MSTKITVIFDNPLDPAAFEDAYADLIDRARKIPPAHSGDRRHARHGRPHR
jgi:hypothetical protein